MAKVGGGANSWRQKVETCFAGFTTCTCSWWCIVWVYKTDQTQHGTPVQRCLNAGAALKLMAITASVPGQRLAFTRPLVTLSMRHIEMNRSLVQLMYKYTKHETYTRCSFNVNSDSIMDGFCVWSHEVGDPPSPKNVGPSVVIDTHPTKSFSFGVEYYTWAEMCTFSVFIFENDITDSYWTKIIF